MRLAPLALLCGVACVDPQGGPVAVVWDRDACEECSMVISDHAFTTEIRAPKGQVHKFDDLGCAVRWLEAQPWAPDTSVAIWVARQSDGGWIDARTAHYVGGQSSPMGYGFGAIGADSPGVTFDDLRARLAKPKHNHAQGRPQ
jgi:nitrous oxide reductase accessory protein NosL